MTRAKIYLFESVGWSLGLSAHQYILFANVLLLESLFLWGEDKLSQGWILFLIERVVKVNSCVKCKYTRCKQFQCNRSLKHSAVKSCKKCEQCNLFKINKILSNSHWNSSKETTISWKRCFIRGKFHSFCSSAFYSTNFYLETRIWTRSMISTKILCQMKSNR